MYSYSISTLTNLIGPMLRWIRIVSSVLLLSMFMVNCDCASQRLPVLERYPSNNNTQPDSTTIARLTKKTIAELEEKVKGNRNEIENELEALQKQLEAIKQEFENSKTANSSALNDLAVNLQEEQEAREQLGKQLLVLDGIVKAQNELKKELGKLVEDINDAGKKLVENAKRQVEELDSRLEAVEVKVKELDSRLEAAEVKVEELNNNMVR